MKATLLPLLQSDGQLAAVSFLSNEQTASPQTALSPQSAGQLVVLSVVWQVRSPQMAVTTGVIVARQSLVQVADVSPLLQVPSPQ